MTKQKCGQFCKVHKNSCNLFVRSLPKDIALCLAEQFLKKLKMIIYIFFITLLVIKGTNHKLSCQENAFEVCKKYGSILCNQYVCTSLNAQFLSAYVCPTKYGSTKIALHKHFRTVLQDINSVKLTRCKSVHKHALLTCIKNTFHLPVNLSNDIFIT